MIKKLTAKDIPWLKQTIKDCREGGHDKVADMFAEELQRIIEKKQNKT